MNKKKLILLLIFILGESAFGLGRDEAKKAFEAIREAEKIYHITENKTNIIFLNERGIEPVLKEKTVDYQFFVNKKKYLNILDVYFQKNEKWINLGLYSGLKNPNVSYELPLDKMPFDLEVESDKNFTKQSNLEPLTVFEKQVFEELNKVRTNPKEYAKKLRDRIPLFEGNVYYPPDTRPFQTREGVKGIESAIAIMENAKPQSQLIFSSEISYAIQNHFKQNISYTSHWRELRERYGKYLEDPELINIIESQYFGFNIPSDLVAYIFSIQGKRRGNFKDSIFDTDISYLGLACKKDPSYRYMCHITLAGGLSPSLDFKEYQLSRNKTSNFSYLSEFEKSVIDETNFLRTKPKEYAELLKQRRAFYFDKIYREPNRTPITVEEGISALEEAIQFLEKANPVGDLTPSEELTLSAKDHVVDTGPKGITGHYGSDNSSPSTRIQKRKKNFKLVGENIYYGTVDPRDVVISLLVDDGISNRGHRTNLFHKDFKYIGVSCGFHRDYPLICVQNFGTW